ncbi:uncharacterized protein LOC130901357 [Diorhabda carinulata]|uniref:uncharacterized protein LOC130901357 n=1 Tax=Diorhabda carinulata TaxID=1163345 RepID=UPI0025A16A2E|nr:uncharacterized protein LOC130901357 [Diorhabda carinulata]
MELRKTLWILLILFSSTEVLCVPLDGITYISINENPTTSNKTQYSTTEVEDKIDKNENSTEKSGSDDMPNELEHLLPTNSSNFAYTYVSDDNKDTEVSDMLNIPASSVDYDLAPNQPKIVYKPDDSVNTSIFLKDDSINVNLEGMKNYGDETIAKRSDLDHIAIVPGTIAAILAGVFLVVSIAGYISLLSWRRYLENRYGNREMLVEDDYCEKSINDLEHFSI